MASHCHPYHHHRPPTTATTACCCCSSTPSHHPPPPEPLTIQCQSIHPSPTQPHLSSPYSPFNLQTHQRYQQTQYYYPPQTPNHKQYFQRHRYHQDEEEEANPMVSSLLRRISALESSIRRHSSASLSLGDAAARTIQTHFRAFLVRRSRTLRQLKDLAFIKSALNTLKSTHSNNTHSDSRALSHKAIGLLHRLDSIQGGDPMIRDGKRSINRELTRFMEYLDELSMKRYQLSSRAVKRVGRGGTGTKSRVLKEDERELLEKLSKRVEKIEGLSRVSEEEDVVEVENPRTCVNGKSGVSQIRNGVLMKWHSGVQAKAKKNVSFAENGNVYMVYRRSNGPVSVSECNSFDGGDSVDAEEFGREVEEIGTGDDEEEAHTDDNESPQISDDDRDPRRKMVAESDNEMSVHDPIEKEDGSFVFSAPLPVKMEPRPDLMNKKTVKRTN